MNLTSLIKEVTPPVVLRIARLFQKRLSAHQYFIKTYSSYGDAMRACVTESGYSDDEIVKVIFEKTKILVGKLKNDSRTSINATDAFSLLPFLRLGSKTSLNIIDLGGACGAHYFYNRKIINSQSVVKWCVVETKAMCDYARALETDELVFEHDFPTALQRMVPLDLLFTSGTIQCVSDPYGFLELIVNSGADYILFNRLGLTNGDHDVITTHKSMLGDNGIGPLPTGFTDKPVEYPFNFIQKSKFETLVKSKYDYEITWNDPTGIFPVNDEPIVGMGILCKLKNRE